MKGWPVVRGVVVMLFVIASLLAPLGPAAQPPMGWGAILALVLVSPVALLLVIGFQALNPLSAKAWRRPSWRINPFNIREPLQFFHLIGHAFLAGGLVTLVRVLFWAGPFYPEAAMPIALATGIFIGLRLTMWVCHRKLVIESHAPGRSAA